MTIIEAKIEAKIFKNEVLLNVPTTTNLELMIILWFGELIKG
ncbi:hypothetical protein WwAna0446 [Wolbachia endosymbiont of Drosophila ananassae]|nr:hypothetical protein WwAna0446 [Wolbachia endosymbiont of Drosophila ananassae]